jgi:uncharacterized protein (DUF1501 family)
LRLKVEAGEEEAMGGCRENQQIARRSFLRTAGMGLGALTISDPLLDLVARSYGQTSSGTGNLLVLCELNGGLDVLSFLAPIGNSVYQSKRPVLALNESTVNLLPGRTDLGINNLLPFFSNLYNQGELAFVQQVGYPDANGSHFESQEVYQFGVRNLGGGAGTSAPWYERLRRTYFDNPFGVLDTRSIGDPSRYGYPDSTYRRAAQDAFGRLARLKAGRTESDAAILSAYDRIDVRGEELRSRTEDFESTGEPRGDFYRAAKLASAKLDTQVIKLNYGGFDTHGSQDEANLSLFPNLDNQFSQFVSDLKALGLWERTCVLFYTEFGRRNEENGSPGTDHGHGSHIILAGPSVKGGLHGQEVSTADLNEKSLPYYVDFRAVFGNVIQNWLGFDPRPIFQIGGETYDTSVGSNLFS